MLKLNILLVLLKIHLLLVLKLHLLLVLSASVKATTSTKTTPATVKAYEHSATVTLSNPSVTMAGEDEPVVVDVAPSNANMKHMWKSFRTFSEHKDDTLTWLSSFEEIARTTQLNNAGMLETVRAYLSVDVRLLLDSTCPAPATFAIWKANFLAQYQLSEVQRHDSWSTFISHLSPRPDQTVAEFVSKVQSRAVALGIDDNAAMLGCRTKINSTLACAFTTCKTIKDILCDPKSRQITCFAFNPPTAPAQPSVTSLTKLPALARLSLDDTAQVCAAPAQGSTSYGNRSTPSSSYGNHSSQHGSKYGNQQQHRDNNSTSQQQYRDNNSTSQRHAYRFIHHENGKCNYCDRLATECSDINTCTAQGKWCEKCGKRNHLKEACKRFGKQ